MKLLRQLIAGFICACFANSYATCLSDSVATDTIPYSELSEVIVTVERPSAILKADKVTYNPATTVSGSNKNVYEAIQSLPGINISTTGEITVNGIQGVAIYIDGKKNIMTGDNLTNFLRSLAITEIENIEISNSASAKDGADRIEK